MAFLQHTTIPSNTLTKSLNIPGIIENRLIECLRRAVAGSQVWQDVTCQVGFSPVPKRWVETCRNKLLWLKKNRILTLDSLDAEITGSSWKMCFFFSPGPGPITAKSLCHWFRFFVGFLGRIGALISTRS